ncbi:MAG TPA: glycosyltransferase [Polyangia bacterium]|nr:glycosyltransferase [Polyangia bacterium]
MRLTITTPAKFPAAFAAAREHARRRELARIASPVPATRTRRFGVPRRRTVALAPLGAWDWLAQRALPRPLQAPHQHAFSVAFDVAASRALGHCDAVNAWCSTALHTIRAAHRRGLPAVLEVASVHIETQAHILGAQFARYGAAADRGVISPRVVARTLREYAEADAVIAISQLTKRTLVERGVPAEKVAVIPYGVDASAYARAPIARARDSRTPRILFVGGVSLRKGIPYLLDAFRMLDRPAELRLVGRRNDALVGRLGGLPPHVTSAGPKTGATLAAEYAAADIFVLPSVEDGWGLVTNEAMAAGLPVVVSDAAGSSELVREGETGFVVPACDAAALARALDTLLADAALRHRMGERARELASARTWSDYVDDRNRLVFGPLLRGAPIGEASYARAA